MDLVMTVVESGIKEEPRKLTLDESIQRVEDLTMLINRWRKLYESRRKLQSFIIGADTISSLILLKDKAGNEFKTSNSEVIALWIEEMKLIRDTKVSPRDWKPNQSLKKRGSESFPFFDHGGGKYVVEHVI